MNQYADLDKMILGALDRWYPLGGWLGFIAIAARPETERIAAKTGRDKYLILDGRLQALRKAGQIKYDSKIGWLMQSEDSKGSSRG